jgi:rubrerythrin
MKLNGATNALALRVLFASLFASSTCFAVFVGCGGDTGATASTGDEPCRPASAVDAPGGCWTSTYTVPLIGNTTNPALCPLVGGTKSGAICRSFCGWESTCSLYEEADGTPVAVCGNSCTVDGRRPEGLPPTHDGEGLGAHFARMAYHEAAAVLAFEVLARELEEHGAPRALLRALHRAVEDEKVHARLAADLAARFGHAATNPEIAKTPTRSLEAIALENAREGCSRETLGVLVGLHQARHAHDPDVRAFYARIARDESRHAALSWRMHAWLRRRLGPHARARVDAELARAFDTMTVPHLDPALGAPSREVFDRAKRALLAA